jgi:hypothetical protein
MALQAVGWLSSKLGVNIAGRGGEKEEQPTMFTQISDTVFGGTTSGTVTSEGEVDANGLPVGRNWYYYDEELKRFNVHPSAPEHIKAEHARQVAAMEAEKSCQGSPTVAPPPPPPPMLPPPGSAPNASPPPRANGPQYADAGFFN